MENMKTDILIIGAGPAGMLEALLLVKKGIKVVLVDKTKDFKREFRGEFLQPGVMNLFKKIGLYEKLIPFGEKILRYDISENGANILDFKFPQAGYNIRQSFVLPIMLKEIQTQSNGNFIFLNETSIDRLIEEDHVFTGAILKNHKTGRQIKVRSKLVIAADGRNSRINELVKTKIANHAFNMDVFWVKIPRPVNMDTTKVQIRIYNKGSVVLMPSFPNKFQMGVNLPKGGSREMRKIPIEKYVTQISEVVPEARKQIQEAIKSWHDFTYLNVSGGVSKKWSYNGLTLIGDSAHTVGPAMGQGINQAMEDAIIMSNIVKDNYNSSMPYYPEKILKRLQDERFDELVELQDLQSKQEALINSHGEEATKNRKVAASELIKNKKDIGSLITMSDIDSEVK